MKGLFASGLSPTLSLAPFRNFPEYSRSSFSREIHPSFVQEPHKNIIISTVDSLLRVICFHLLAGWAVGSRRERASGACVRVDDERVRRPAGALTFFCNFPGTPCYASFSPQLTLRGGKHPSEASKNPS